MSEKICNQRRNTGRNTRRNPQRNPRRWLKKSAMFEEISDRLEVRAVLAKNRLGCLAVFLEPHHNAFLVVEQWLNSRFSGGPQALTFTGQSSRRSSTRKLWTRCCFFPSRNTELYTCTQVFARRGETQNCTLYTGGPRLVIKAGAAERDAPGLPLLPPEPS